MKTQNKKLDFNKNSVTELQDNKLLNVTGGSTGKFCDLVGDAIDAINDALDLLDGLPKL